MKNRKFKFQHRINHWLGDGIYFFVNDFEAASWWAKNRFSDGVVIYGKLQIEKDNLLDLDTLEGAKKLELVIDDFKKNGYDINLTDEDSKFIKNHPKDLENIQRSKFLTLASELLDFKACSYSFPINVKRYDNIIKYGITPKERQLNIIDQSIINFDNLSFKKV
ncbi:hypothetical protein [Companilactobacillus zhachilii]|uniref:hypothetical protein n=1 Tax=Companilactobacillus zhachilii TaxID=2304606 RepID=UPI0040332F63